MLTGRGDAVNEETLLGGGDIKFIQHNKEYDLSIKQPEWPG